MKKLKKSLILSNWKMERDKQRIVNNMEKEILIQIFYSNNNNNWIKKQQSKMEFKEIMTEKKMIMV